MRLAHCLGLVLLISGSLGLAADDPGLLTTRPEGLALVREKGAFFNNRPLYCKGLNAFVLGGDRPLIRFGREPWQYGTLMLALANRQQARWLHHFGQVRSAYRAARLEWTLRDETFPGRTVTLELVTLASGAGLALKASVAGAQPGDRLLWVFGGARPREGNAGANLSWELDPLGGRLIARDFQPAECEGDEWQLAGRGFSMTDSEPGWPAHVVAGASNTPGARLVDAGAWETPDSMLVSQPGSQPLVAGELDLASGQPLYWACEAWPTAEGRVVATPPKPAEAFRAGLARARTLGQRVLVDTPDAYLDALASVASAAIEGVWNPPVFIHGGMLWNIPFPGWRTLFGGMAYGWHDRVRQEGAYYLGFQVKESDNKLPRLDPQSDYTLQAGDSRFTGRGWVARDNWPYNFQSQHFDQLARDWRSAPDAAFEPVLREGLELQLEWEKDCFDPDGDGLYESYINTWPTDSVWYSGAGATEETSYAYYAQRAARDLALRAGDKQDAAAHEAELAHIKAAFHAGLWAEDEGHPGVCREQIGYKRLRKDAWLYSCFLPIDAGLLTPVEALQTLYYTEWGLQRDRLPYGGEVCWTSNWVPSLWSVRELYPGDNYHLSLAYFQAGLPDEGWAVMKGTLRKQSYGGKVPGDLGAPNGGTDFNDCSSMFCRALVEGLFGFRPDYPAGKVVIAPQLPSDWPSGSIKTPDFSFRFERQATGLECRVELTRSAQIELHLPLSAEHIASVLLNGKPMKYTVEPSWGQSLLRIEAPFGRIAEVTVAAKGVRPRAQAQQLEARAGERLQLTCPDAPLVGFEDPQGILTSPKLEAGKLVAQVAPREGHFLVLGLADVGQLRQRRLFKLAVTNPAAEAEREAKTNLKVAADSTWRLLGLGEVANGDIRKLFDEDYLSPRPQTVSSRIGKEGYFPWTMRLWQPNGEAPAPKLDKLPELTESFLASAYQASAPGLDLTEEFTLEMWLTPEAMGEMGGRLLDKSLPGTLDGYLFDTWPGNSLRFLNANGSVSASQVLTPGKPARVAAVLSLEENRMELYLDGKIVAKATSPHLAPLTKTAHPLLVGVDPNGQNRLLGIIERVRIWARPLSPVELASEPDNSTGLVAEWAFPKEPTAEVPAAMGNLTLERFAGDDEAPRKLRTPQGVPFLWGAGKSNVAFASQWDNWPHQVKLNVGAKAQAAWFLVGGTTNPMQTRIANAELRLNYADGVVEKLELVPPLNFWGLSPYCGYDYNYDRDAFCLPKTPPQTVQLGENCRAILLPWRLREGVKLDNVTLETLSPEVVIGLLGVSLENPKD